MGIVDDIKEVVAGKVVDKAPAEKPAKKAKPEVQEASDVKVSGVKVSGPK